MASPGAKFVIDLGFSVDRVVTRDRTIRIWPTSILVAPGRTLSNLEVVVELGFAVDRLVDDFAAKVGCEHFD